MARVRMAGTGRTAEGDRVTWSVAEGRRGRRWREAVSGEAGLRHSLLLETGADDRFAHLELATPTGLLTLHPEGDGTLHGNVVTGDGIWHVVGLPWPPDGCLVVPGSPLAAAVIAHLLRHVIAPGASIDRTILRIGADLELAVRPARIARQGTDAWAIDGDVHRIDGDGLPRLDAGTTWPMEIGEAG